MQIVIDIPEEAYKLLKNDGVDWLGAEHILNAVANGTPLPDGAEILTKEAYNDLRLRATAYDDLYLRASRAYGGDEE